MRPEVQTSLYDGEPPPDGAQDFAACVEATHVSWLIAQRAFTGGAEAHRRAGDVVARMGYVLRGVRPRRRCRSR